MKNKKMRNYHYLVLFMIGFLVLWPFMLHRLYMEREKNTEEAAWKQEEELIVEPEEEAVSEAPGETEEEASEEEGDAGLQERQDEADQETKEDPGEEQEEPGESGEPKEELTREEFFQDTLFIGDSRTMGLAEYSDLGNAVFFANTGMNIYRLYSLKNAVHDQEADLEDILSEKQYRRIYLMLGVNELGYDEAQTVKRYEKEVLNLQKLQPEAKIVLEANLHVTTERSERDTIFNNGGIDRINESIRQIAEKYGFSYIDVNEIFDDETGGLNPEYTHDEVHVLGKYYQQWADWIWENGI